MPLTISQLTSYALPGDFVAKIKQAATIVGLAPNSWPQTGIAAVIISVAGNLLGVPKGSAYDSTLAAKGIDGLVTALAMGGFLDTAAQITPDPPVQSSDGTFNAPLDLLADSEFNEQRNGATFATGPVTLTNSGATRGPFAVGGFHLVDPAGNTYSNTTVLTLTGSGADTTGTFAADVAGARSVVANTLVLATALVGVIVKTAGGANSNTLVGVNADSNATLVGASRGHLQSLGPKLGPNGAYVYFAQARRLAGYPVLAGAAITRVFASTDKYTGIVTVYLANGSGATSSPDAALIQTWLRAATRPDGVTVNAAPAVTNSIAFTVDAYVPTAKAGSAAADVQTAIINYINSLPIGGTAGQVVGVSLSEVIAACFRSVSYLQNLENFQANAATADIALATGQIALASPTPVITVHGTG